MHQTSYDRMEEFKYKYVANHGFPMDVRVLDVGSKNVDNGLSYRTLFEDYTYVGMDLEDGENVDVVGYGSITGTFDVIISGQVMEHVEHPWVWLTQLTTYLVKGGLICIIAPRTWKEHKYPVDCYRFLPDGMKALFKWANIEVLEAFIERRDCIGIGRVL